MTYIVTECLDHAFQPGCGHRCDQNTNTRFLSHQSAHKGRSRIGLTQRYCMDPNIISVCILRNVTKSLKPLTTITRVFKVTPQKSSQNDWQNKPEQQGIDLSSQYNVESAIIRSFSKTQCCELMAPYPFSRHNISYRTRLGCVSSKPLQYKIYLITKFSGNLMKCPQRRAARSVSTGRYDRGTNFSAQGSCYGVTWNSNCDSVIVSTKPFGCSG